MAQSPRSLTKDATIRVTARDNASATLKRVQGSLRSFATALIARQVGQALENAGKQVLSIAENAGKMAMDFDAAWSKIGVLTGKLGMSLDAARQHVLDLGGATGQAPRDLADALYFVASAGLKVNQVMPVLDVAAKGAAEGLGSVQDVARTLIGALNAYRGTQLTATEAMNIFQTAAKLSSAELSDFATGLGPVTGVAAQAGVKIGDLAAAIAQTTTQAIPFARAVTGFRFLISSLESPTEAAKNALADYGFTAQEIHKQLSQPGGLQHVMQTLAKTFDLTSVKGRDAWRAVTGGIRGAIVANTLVGKQTAATNKLLAQMNKKGTETSGVFDRAFEVIKKRNPALALAMVQEKLHGIEIELANNFLPTWIEFLQRANELLDRFKALDPAVKNFIARAFVLSGVFLLVTGKILKLFAALKGMQALLMLTNTGWLAMTATLGGAIIAVGLLAAAGFLIVKNWKTVGPFFMKLVDGMRKSAQHAFDVIKSWWDKNGKRVTQEVLDLGKAIGSFLAAAFKVLAAVLPPIIIGVAAFVKGILPLVTAAFNLGSTILNWLLPVLKPLAPLIRAVTIAFLAWKALSFVTGLITAITVGIQTFTALLSVGGLPAAFSMFSRNLQAVEVSASRATGQLSLFETEATGAKGSAALLKSTLGGLVHTLGNLTIGLGVALGVKGLLKLASDAKDLRKELDAVKKVLDPGLLVGIDQATDKTAGWAEKVASLDIALGLGKSDAEIHRHVVEDVADAYQKLIDRGIPAIVAQKAIGRAFYQTADIIGGAKGNLDEWNTAFRGAIGLGPAAVKGISTTRDAMLQFYLTSLNSTRGYGDFLNILTHTKDILDPAVGAVIDLANQHNILAGGLTKSEQAWINVYMRAGDYAGALKMLQRFTVQDTLRNKEFNEELTKHERRLIAAKLKTGDYAAALAMLERFINNSKERTDKQAATFDRANAKVKALTGNVIDYGDNLRLLPHESSTKFKAPNLGSVLEQVRTLNGLLVQISHPANVDVLLTKGNRQSGGPVRSGQSYIVGERGPEVFRPAVSGRVSSHGENVPSGDGKRVTNNWYIYGAKMTAEELMREVDWRERTRGW